MGELLTNHHGVEVEAAWSMEMAPGVNPRPGRVPEQELLTPETWFLVAAELRNSSGEIVDSFRVFASGGINRRRGGGWSDPRGPHPTTARLEGRAAPP